MVEALRAKTKFQARDLVSIALRRQGQIGLPTIGKLPIRSPSDEVEEGPNLLSIRLLSRPGSHRAEGASSNAYFGAGPCRPRSRRETRHGW